ncbi:MAG: hypothetical protein ACI4FZ_12660 [Lachnospiraceae bacterium]
MAEDITNNPLFQNLSPVKREVLQEVVNSTENLPLDKALPLLLKANIKLKKKGESFTKEESAFLITELTKQLTPQERAKVAALMKLL